MNDKTNLIVFAKKEVALIFLIMILIAITSFIIGVKIGKTFAYQEVGITSEDKARIDLLSEQEEQVNKVTAEGVQAAPSEEKAQDTLDKFNLKAEEKIIQEIKGTSSANVQMSEKPSESAKPDEGKAVVTESSLSMLKKKDQMTGKFTIQLGSHRSIDEAEKFADGFRIRGYDPIINEVEIPGQGTWYRVSIGVFESIQLAKDFIIKEKSLFLGTDYVIGRFD